MVPYSRWRIIPHATAIIKIAIHKHKPWNMHIMNQLQYANMKTIQQIIIEIEMVEVIPICIRYNQHNRQHQTGRLQKHTINPISSLTCFDIYRCTQPFWATYKSKMIFQVEDNNMGQRNNHPSPIPSHSFANPKQSTTSTIIIHDKYKKRDGKYWKPRTYYFVTPPAYTYSILMNNLPRWWEEILRLMSVDGCVDWCDGSKMGVDGSAEKRGRPTINEVMPP